MFGSSVRGSTETCGDAVAVCTIVHAVHDPVTAGLYSLSRLLRQLHRHPSIAGGHRGHLRYCERLTAQLHHLPPVLLHHPLHLIQVTPLEGLRRHVPVEGIGSSFSTSVSHAKALNGGLPICVAVVSIWKFHLMMSGCVWRWGKCKGKWRGGEIGKFQWGVWDWDFPESGHPLLGCLNRAGASVLSVGWACLLPMGLVEICTWPLDLHAPYPLRSRHVSNMYRFPSH